MKYLPKVYGVWAKTEAKGAKGSHFEVDILKLKCETKCTKHNILSQERGHQIKFFGHPKINLTSAAKNEERLCPSVYL